MSHPQDPFEPDTNAPLIVSPLAALWRHWYVILLLGLGGGTAAAAFSLTRPNTYQAEGKLLVRTGSRERSPLESEVVGGDRGGLPRESDVVQDVLQLMDSISTAEHVVADLGAARIRTRFQPTLQITEDTPAIRRGIYRLQEWWYAPSTDPSLHPCEEDCDCDKCLRIAVAILRNGVDIGLVPRSRVIRVRYQTTNAALAQDVVNSYLRVMVVRYREVFGVHPSYEFLRQEKARAAIAAEEAQQSLIEYLQQCDVYDVDLQTSSLMKELTQLEQAESEIRRQISEVTARQTSLEGLLEREEEVMEQPLEPTTVANPAHQSLVTLRNSLRLRRWDLLERLTEDSEEVRSMDLEIEALEQRLTQMEPVLVVPREGVQLTPNPTWSRLRTSWEQGVSNLEGLQATHREIGKDLEDRRSRLREVQDCSPLARALEVDARSRSRTAEELHQAYEQMTVRNALYLESAGNLRSIEKARRPTQRAGSPRSKLVVAGLGGGTMAGALLAMLLAARNRRLRTPQEVRRRLGADVLAAIPHIKNLERS